MREGFNPESPGRNEVFSRHPLQKAREIVKLLVYRPVCDPFLGPNLLVKENVVRGNTADLFLPRNPGDLIFEYGFPI